MQVLALALVWELGQQTTTLPAVRWRQTQPSPHVQHAVLQRPSPALELELELELELVLELVLVLALAQRTVAVGQTRSRHRHPPSP